MANINPNDVQWDDTQDQSTNKQTLTPKSNSIDPSQVQWDIKEGSPIFTESNIDTPVSESSPLNPLQQYILSHAPNDQTRINYLKEKFSGAQVDQDETGNIRIDGRRINPEGFQFGADVIGNAGYALPVAGQILGGIAGGTAGSIVPGAGTTVGSIGGGVAGGMTGETARLGIGKVMGLDPSLGASVGSIATEGAFSLGGELATRGAFQAAKTGAKVTGADKAIANFWKSSMNKLGNYAPEIAEFLGGVQKDAVKTAQKHGYNRTFTPDNFAEDRMQRIVKRTIFGDENVDLLKLSTTNPTLNGIEEGAVSLAKSIKKVGNDAYDSLIKQYSGLTNDTINTIKASNPAELFSKSNLSNDRAFVLAGDFEHMAQKKLNELGKQLSKVENEAIKKASSKATFQHMAVDDLGKKLNGIISEIKGNIRVPEFQTSTPYRIPGLNELEAMKHALGGMVDDGTGNRVFRFFGEEVKSRGGQIKRVLDSPNLKQLSKRLGAIDNIADALYANKQVSPKVKVAARDWLREIRGRYDARLGIADQSAVYSAFKEVVGEAKIDRNTFLASFEGQIKNFRNITGSQRNAFNTVLENLDQASSKTLIKNIDLMNAGGELKKFNTKNTVSKLQSSLNNSGIISTIKDQSTDESTLRQIDGLLKTSKSPSASRLAFMDDAEMSIAAKEFLKGSPNLLRIGALTSMIGGFQVGGPIGAVAGIAISQPRNIARGLAALERGVSLPQSVRRGLQTATQVAPAVASRSLSGLSRKKDQR